MGPGLLNRRPAGFTLIEVLIAVAILGFALMGAQAAFTSTFTRTTVRQDQVSIALQLVEDHLSTIQAFPVYDSLTVRFNATTATGIANYPGFTRVTRVARTTAPPVDGRIRDFTRVTVQVHTPPPTTTVSRTVSIGAP